MSDACYILADTRRQAGLTQAQLAERARTHQSRISRYESGEYPITMRELDRLLRVMGKRIVLETRRL